jgi:DNA-binding MarR family transcriptional regulator
MYVTSATVKDMASGGTPVADVAVPAVGEVAVELDLASLAVRLMDHTKQDIREIGDEEGLSVPQLDVVRRLRAHGPTPMRRLAEQMNCEASNLTGLVDRLESRGLVERLPDPADRRVRVLALTPKGEELAYETWAAVARRCPLNSLPPEKRAVLDDLLREALLVSRRAGGASAPSLR